MSKTRRWLVLATVSAGLLMVSVDTTVLYTALSTLTGDLRADASQKLWIINAYPLVMAGLLLGAGTLGDRIGRLRRPAPEDEPAPAPPKVSAGHRAFRGAPSGRCLAPQAEPGI